MQQFAHDNHSGVALLNKEIHQNIKSLKNQTDHIIISPHWGDERFHFPSPQQITQAHNMADAGATLILGHHPHVLQGLEKYQQTPISYSLGNFLANHVYWDNGGVLTWNRFERSGCIIMTELNKTDIKSIKQIPTFDDGKNIIIEKSGRGDRYLQKANNYLNKGITTKQYQRETLRVCTINPILAHLHWSQLHRVRPQHLNKALQTFKH
jgi:poly-gamma-glutamate synthesis protein (capsule biosynthesis protein)